MKPPKHKPTELPRAAATTAPSAGTEGCCLPASTDADQAALATLTARKTLAEARRAELECARLSRSWFLRTESWAILIPAIASLALIGAAYYSGAIQGRQELAAAHQMKLEFRQKDIDQKNAEMAREEADLKHRQSLLDDAKAQLEADQRAVAQEREKMRDTEERFEQVRRISGGLVTHLSSATVAGQDSRGVLMLVALAAVGRIADLESFVLEPALDRKAQAVLSLRSEVVNHDAECSAEAVLWDTYAGWCLLESGRFAEAEHLLTSTLGRASMCFPGDPIVERLSRMADVSCVLATPSEHGLGVDGMAAWQRVRHGDFSDMPARIRPALIRLTEQSKDQ